MRKLTKDDKKASGCVSFLILIWDILLCITQVDVLLETFWSVIYGFETNRKKVILYTESVLESLP
jgi:hypothetical protein